MDIGATAATNAYMKAAQAALKPESSQNVGGISGAPFGQILDAAISQTSGAANQAENAIASATMGNADLVDVVTAVAAAEATLETVVAVRDQVISAYQEVMRMPI
ncbi:flagellar hook-basal body complex protein FliE [Hirschia baltica]|uniref:Flagellar hook-basal body complex protein FliE n=1 Tax=Hirschia baltica (strain ATCC 49814 / DSM 5838 / IFAM 1418) TaxID=582402 RepID=C6XNK3_HIRBI|nr:flagellar hook-basal body complex protein FliE [Hirschia baltica]ACT58256.1 flagellar hook-basal body complex subunit FliE [Hirschia baltica ATCC 49814]